MNLAAELPPRLTCLLCFSCNSMARRNDRKGRPFYTCAMCHFRIFLNNDAHLFGVVFWSRALADGRLMEKARAELERILENKHLPVCPPRPIPVAPQHMPSAVPQDQGSPSTAAPPAKHVQP